MIKPESDIRIYIVIFVSVLFCNLSYAQDKRDPFLPLITSDGRLINFEENAQKKEEVLILEGIVYDKSGLSYALVNGEALRIGDEVAGYRILKIEQNLVSFIKGGEITQIELKKEE